MSNVNVVLGVLSLIFLITILVLIMAWRRLRMRGSLLERQQTEIDKFQGLFSHSLSSANKLSDAMDQAAAHIAELIVAKAVCIYRVENDRLLVDGVSGNYPLSQFTIMMDPEGSADEYRQALREEDITIGEGFIGRTASRRRPIFLPDARHDEHLSEFPMERLPEQVMAVPVFQKEQLSGIICAVTSSNYGLFNQDKFAQLKFVAGQVRLIMDLEGAYKTRSAQERLKQELGFARQLQASLLPESVPDWDKFAIFAKTNSAKEVNGDFYDYVRIDDNRLLIVMGDACGKGVPACLLASMTRSFIRAAADHFTTLEALLREVNRNLYRDTDAERYVTMGCCLLDKQHGIMEYARAGHTELVYFILGHIRRLYPDGTGLGVLPDEYATFDTISLEMQPGMTVLLYSDGITEALDINSDEFGVDRLAHELEVRCTARLSAEEVLDGLLDTVREFEPEQHDDRTAILIRRR